MEIKIRLQTDTGSAEPYYHWLQITGNSNIIEFEIVGYDEAGRRFGVGTAELLAAINAIKFMEGEDG